MAKAEASVEELVGMIERGELRLPEMQRRYVWRSTRVRDLLDSLYRGYPSGAILLWDSESAVPLRDFSVAHSGTPINSTRLLLDGQQRLTSLAAVIRGMPVTVRGRRKPLELLFNLDHPDALAVVTEVNEEGKDDDVDDDEADSTEDDLQKRFNRMTFVVSTKRLEQLPHWVRVTEVFQTASDTQFLKRAGVTGFDDPRYERYSQRLGKLRNVRKYVYRMDVLERHLSYHEVTEIFVRVNSLGAKLRSSDLALAQITAKWRGSLAIFQRFQSDCSEKAKFDLDLGLHLKNLIAFTTGQSRFLTVAGLTAGALQQGWHDCVPGMDFALNFLRKNVTIDSPALLSSPFLLVTLAYYGHKRMYEVSEAEAERLRQWVLVANAKGRYSRGSTETYLDQDLKTVREGGSVDALLDALRLQVGTLGIAPEELEGRNQRSSLFKTMFLAFRAAGARDWRSNLAIAFDHSGTAHKLQFHHIFPKDILKATHGAGEVDDIANLAFIGGKTNRRISATEPSTYFPPTIAKAGAASFAAQCIPTDSALLTVTRYKAFLSERRKLIARRLNEYLGVSAT